MKELIDEISILMETFRENAKSQLDKGNNSAGLRGRRASLNLEPLLKRFRKVSLEASNDPTMKLPPFQKTVLHLNKSLPTKEEDIGRWLIDHGRPHFAVRHNDLVTVCFCCGNTIVHYSNDRYVRCENCGRAVEIIEEQDWLASKRMISRYFATLYVIEGIQLMRTFNVTLSYSTINRLKSASVLEICCHRITPDGRCAVTSRRRFTSILMPKGKAMKLRKDSTDAEDLTANHAYIRPYMKLLPELAMKLALTNKIMLGNALSTIRNLLEPDCSTLYRIDLFFIYILGFFVFHPLRDSPDS